MTALLVVAFVLASAAAAVLGWLHVRQRVERRRTVEQLARVQTLLDSARGLAFQDSEVAIYEALPLHVRSLVAADRIGLALFQRGHFVGRYDGAGLIDGPNDATSTLEELVVLQNRPVAQGPEEGEVGPSEHRLALPVRSGDAV
ncbi:MAG TPA: hypothetical protein VFZ11_06790, partial [Gemmatimonadaceae bacterium]